MEGGRQAHVGVFHKARELSAFAHGPSPLRPLTELMARSIRVQASKLLPKGCPLPMQFKQRKGPVSRVLPGNIEHLKTVSPSYLMCLFSVTKEQSIRKFISEAAQTGLFADSSETALPLGKIFP